MPQHPDISRITNLLDAQSAKLAACGHRQIIILSGSIEWAASFVDSVLAKNTSNSESNKSLSVITSKDSQLETLANRLTINKRIRVARPEKPNTLLGYENSHVIFDAHSGFNPDALCAISGTIRPGGFLFILAPDLNLWPNHEDSFAKKRLSFGCIQTASSPQTINRFLHTALPLGAICIKEQHTICDLEHQISTSTKRDNSNQTDTHWSLPSDSTHEQKQILANLINDIQNLRAPTPAQQQSFHIIQANRGRGKSHLLGLLANTLSEVNIDNGIKFIITAPNKLSVKTIFDTYNTLSTKQKKGNPLTFVAPENVLTEASSEHILIVDEAASLPTPLLKQWAQHFQFIVFATTTHGYEGTGKGFQIRFLRFLESLKQSIHQHELNSPIRYNHDDPVEDSLFKTFCLDSEPMGLKIKSINSKHIKQCEITQAQLNTHPQLLEDVFSLLIQAHYQTRPSDLRDILDASGLRIFANYQQASSDERKTILAACLVFNEGGLTLESRDIVKAILQGKRRPKGHLTPQVQTLHMGQENALHLKSARIVRIATLPNLQRLNLGSKLLGFVKDTLKTNNYDYVSSSYADTSDVRSFWMKNGFNLIRLGNKLDQSSGTRSGLVMEGISSKGDKLTENCLAFFNNQKNSTASFKEISPTEKTLVRYFLDSTGSYEAIKDILNRDENWKRFFSGKHFPKQANSDFRKLVKEWTEH